MEFSVDQGSFGYHQKLILENISFGLEQGQVLSILGPNGIGKTTLLKCMMGLLKWKSGSTRIDGKNLNDISFKDRWKQIAYVPQAKGNLLGYTAFEMVLLGRSAHMGTLSQPSKEDRNIAEECMKKIDIWHLKDKNCDQMSGGEFQMVLISRAMTTDPKLLILDEPESNLDFKNQLIVLDTIQMLSKEKNISSIINTHYPAHALKISDKALVLYREGASSYGDAKTVISEENLKRAFEVEVKILDFLIEENHYQSVLPLLAYK